MRFLTKRVISKTRSDKERPSQSQFKELLHKPAALGRSLPRAGTDDRLCARRAHWRSEGISARRLTGSGGTGSTWPERMPGLRVGEQHE